MKNYDDKIYPHKDITEKIIGAAIEVHKILGLLLNFGVPFLETKRKIWGNQSE